MHTNFDGYWSFLPTVATDSSLACSAWCQHSNKNKQISQETSQGILPFLETAKDKGKIFFFHTFLEGSHSAYKALP